MWILSWNIRGIGTKIKYKVVRLAEVLNKLDTNCLHETKMVSVKDQKIRSLWPYDVLGFSFSPSIGRSRGLLVVWDIDSLSVGSKIYMLPLLCINFSSICMALAVWLHGLLLAPCAAWRPTSTVIDQKVLWSKVLDLRSSHNGNWVSERIDCSGNIDGSKEFNEIIDRGEFRCYANGLIVGVKNKSDRPWC
ncbi:hypothetical protein V6Z12_A02G028900 [Gossypium hirsutum]